MSLHKSSARIWISGANGFLGNYLCRYFSRFGRSVVPIVRRDHLTHFKCNDLKPVALESFIEGDIRCSQGDFIIHCAARAHQLKDNATDPEKAYYTVNVELTRLLAKRASEDRVNRFIFMSTIKVLGERRDICFTHDDPPAPKDQYSLSKYQAELALKDICKSVKMDYCIIRPPLIYGKGVKGNLHLLNRLLKRPLPLPLGSICNQRDMVGLFNLASLIERTVFHAAAANQCFLVSDNQPVSTSKLIRTMRDCINGKAILFPFPAALLSWFGRIIGRQEQVTRLTESLTVDISFTSARLGWKPPKTFEEGIIDMYKGDGF